MQGDISAICDIMTCAFLGADTDAGGAADVDATATTADRGLASLCRCDVETDTAREHLKGIGRAAVPRICGHVFAPGDICWNCRDCQVGDDTCVICNECFVAGNHEGHDTRFRVVQGAGGGTCDCGDPDAWKPSGFCTKHGATHNVDPRESLPSALRVQAGAVCRAATRVVAEALSDFALGFGDPIVRDGAASAGNSWSSDGDGGDGVGSGGGSRGASGAAGDGAGCSMEQSGRRRLRQPSHGRFVPPALSDKYGLGELVSRYQGAEQCVELTPALPPPDAKHPTSEL